MISSFCVLRSIPYPSPRSFSPVFSSRRFMALNVTFMTMIHFELIFLCSRKIGSTLPQSILEHFHHPKCKCVPIGTHSHSLHWPAPGNQSFTFCLWICCEVHPHFNICQCLISFNGWIIFHCVVRPRVIYPFIGR